MAKRWILLTVLFLLPFQIDAQEDTPYTTTDGRLTVQYPSGWVIDEVDGVVVLSNQEAALVKNGRQLVDDEILISFTMLPVTTIKQELSVTNPMDGMDMLMNMFAGAAFESTFGPTKTILISSYPTALVKGIIEGETGTMMNVMIIVADLESENYLFIVGISAAPRSLMDVTTYTLMKTLTYGE